MTGTECALPRDCRFCAKINFVEKLRRAELFRSPPFSQSLKEVIFMTGTECCRAAMTIMGAGADSSEYYAQFALGALNQLIANSLREINAERVQQGEAAFSVPPRMEALEDELPAPEWLARECLPYGLAALLCADDDKAKFNWAADEYAERLLLHCPAQFTAVQEMV